MQSWLTNVSTKVHVRKLHGTQVQVCRHQRINRGGTPLRLHRKQPQPYQQMRLLVMFENRRSFQHGQRLPVFPYSPLSRLQGQLVSTSIAQGTKRRPWLTHLFKPRERLPTGLRFKRCAMGEITRNPFSLPGRRFLKAATNFGSMFPVLSQVFFTCLTKVPLTKREPVLR